VVRSNLRHLRSFRECDRHQWLRSRSAFPPPTSGPTERQLKAIILIRDDAIKFWGALP
jgi:hypothetical protein